MLLILEGMSMYSKSCSCCGSRLCKFAFGIAFGFLSGLSMLLFAWSAYYWGHGGPMIAQWAEIYQGYAPTIKGGLIGGAWGFVEGFVCGFIFALIYNLVSCCCKCCKCKCCNCTSCKPEDSMNKKM